MPDLLKSPSVRWNKETLFDFAKASFRNFKLAWKAQVDEDKARRKSANERTNRWLGRRREVSVHTIDIGILIPKNHEEGDAFDEGCANVHK